MNRALNNATCSYYQVLWDIAMVRMNFAAHRLNIFNVQNAVEDKLDNEAMISYLDAVNHRVPFAVTLTRGRRKRFVSVVFKTYSR